jgi:hypothetical protein
MVVKGVKGGQMSEDMQKALNAINRDSDSLQAAIFELIGFFPGIANWLAWQDKIFTGAAEISHWPERFA